MRDGEERGLTLIEMLVALLLLAFVALGSVSLLTVTMHQNKLAQKRSLATNLAAERIELVTTQRWEPVASYQNYALPGETAVNGPPATLTADYGAIPGYPEFRRVLTLSYGSPVSGMLKLEAQVFWQDLMQGEKQHSLITYVHPGLEQGQ